MTTGRSSAAARLRHPTMRVPSCDVTSKLPMTPERMARSSSLQTVQDVTDVFLRARERGAWPAQTVVDALPGSTVPAFDGLRCEWDEAAGEEWIRLLKTSMVLALLWVPGP